MVKEEGMASKAWNTAWENYYQIRKRAQKEYDRGNMTPNEFKRRVIPALNRACNTRT